MHDLIIIGGGPAGMTAAVYAARKFMRTLLISRDMGGQTAASAAIENYMGFQFITGPELAAKFEEQVRQFGVEQELDTVTAIEPIEEGFLVRTEGGAWPARTVIIAAGKRPRKLGVPGEEELTGRGVSYCSTCDGPFFAGQDVAVIGGGDAALQAALEMAKMSPHVYLVSRGPWRAEPIMAHRVRRTKNIESLIGYVVDRVVGESQVDGVMIRPRDGSEARQLAVHGVFVEIGSEPYTEFAGDLVERNERGEILVNLCNQTGIPGLFAAGDITQVCEKQIIVAAGEGAKAALKAFEYLLHLDDATDQGTEMGIAPEWAPPSP